MYSFKPLRPGVQFMRLLRLPTKLGVLALVLFVPLVIISLLLTQRVNESIAFTEAEIHGARMAQQLNAVVVEVQKHRGQTNMLLSGDAGARAALQETRQQLQTRLAAVDQLLAERPDFGLDTEWRPLRQAASDLAASERMQAPESFARHSALVRDLRHGVSCSARPVAWAPANSPAPSATRRWSTAWPCSLPMLRLPLPTSCICSSFRKSTVRAT
ncbi:MAG: hypothetical protein MUF76_01280 [Hydrogenophaga sp.]|nr:hypothetical protein [Hydrogenophaga sp.]